MPLKNLDLKLKDLKWGKAQEKLALTNRGEYMTLNADNFAEERKIMSNRHNEEYYHPIKKENYNYMTGVKNSFLPYVKVFKKIEQDKVILVNQEKWVVEWAKKKTFQPVRDVEWVITPTFQKIFYAVIKEKGENLTKMALNNSGELELLLTNAKNRISQNFIWFIEQEIAQVICQTANYNKKALFLKKETEWKQLEKIVDEMALWPTQMLYFSKNWNKEGENNCLREKNQLLLIIDSLLYQNIKNTNYNHPRFTFPQPLLGKLENEFPTIIHFPLKNNFQYIIIDKNALIVWSKTSQTEIKYDENNPLTYLVDYMIGGVEQLSSFNAVAGVKQ